MRVRPEIQPTVQVTFHGLRSSDALTGEVRERIAWLEQFYDGITACRVRIEVPHRHSGRRHLHVHVEISVRGANPIVVTQEHRFGRVAVWEAFDIARRRLSELARERREVYAE